jgi:hypothetical protein
VSHPNNLAVKNFDAKYYESLGDNEQTELLQCLASGIMNEDSGMGCYAMQVRLECCAPPRSAVSHGHVHATACAMH